MRVRSRPCQRDRRVRGPLSRSWLSSLISTEYYIVEVVRVDSGSKGKAPVKSAQAKWWRERKHARLATIAWMHLAQVFPSSVLRMVLRMRNNKNWRYDKLYPSRGQGKSWTNWQFQRLPNPCGSRVIKSDKCRPYIDRFFAQTIPRAP